MLTTAARTTPGTIETVRLTNGDFKEEGEARSIRALLFGAMLDRAEPIVQHYRSDLYHDALWINEFIHGEFTWYWMLRQHGTHVGTDLSEAVKVFGRNDYNVYFKVTLVRDRTANWNVIFETLPLPGSH
jgi:hypothetical protein